MERIEVSTEIADRTPGNAPESGAEDRRFHSAQPDQPSPRCAAMSTLWYSSRVRFEAVGDVHVDAEELLADVDAEVVELDPPGLEDAVAHGLADRLHALREGDRGLEEDAVDVLGVDGLDHVRPDWPGLDRASSERLVERFMAGRSPNTRQAYADDLADFAAWLGLEPAAAVGQLLVAGAGAGNGLALDYLNYLRELGRARATVNRRLAALRSLVKLARLLGLVTWSIEVSGEKLKRYRDTRGPGLDGVRRLLASLERRRDPKAIRDRAIVRLLFDLALRRGELVGLDLEHLDLGAGAVAVLGKGDGERELLTLPHETAATLRAWLELRGDEPGPLFVNFDRAGKGQRLTTTSVYRMVRRLGDQAGVRVRPHGLRHGAITAVLDLNGGDVRAAQRFSRQLDLRTFTHYDDNREDLGGRMSRLVAAAL
jgi:integrase/recombinase XerC